MVEKIMINLSNIVLIYIPPSISFGHSPMDEYLFPDFCGGLFFAMKYFDV